MKTNKISKSKIIYFIAALLCIILFAVCVYFILNPTAVQKVSDGGFDTSRDFIKFMDQTTPNMIQGLKGIFARKPLISRGI